MPEARDRTEGVGQLGIHPTALIVRSAVSRGRVIRSPSDDKENVTPVGVVRRARRRSGEWKSPLPVWYPRTPLRDITAVVNALERRKTRARAIALRQRSQGTETSPLNPRITNPITSEESSISGQATPPTENPPLSDVTNPITSEESSISGQATPPTENPPQSDVLDLTTSSPVATPTEQPAPPPPTTPVPSSLPAPLLDQATHNPTPVAPEKSLLISTKFREKKIVMENQKAKTANAGVGNVKRRSTLMSMR